MNSVATVLSDRPTSSSVWRRALAHRPRRSTSVLIVAGAVLILLWLWSYTLRSEFALGDRWMIGSVEGGVIALHHAPHTFGRTYGGWPIATWKFDPRERYWRTHDPNAFGRFSLLGFGVGATRSETFVAATSVVVPYWLLVVVVLALPLRRFWQSLKALVRARYYGPGKCPQCGYDLRATPNRCPECGLDVTPPLRDARIEGSESYDPPG